MLTCPVPDRPATAGWLGAVAVVLGVFLTAVHGNEILKQAVMLRSAPLEAGGLVAVCPPGELEEEGLTRAECEHLVANARGVLLATPAWFPRYQIALSLAGVAAAFLSIIVGAALVGARERAPEAAVAIFVALAAIDAAGFVAAVNTGPILRQQYLADTLLWLLLHLMLAAGAAANLRGARPA